MYIFVFDKVLLQGTLTFKRYAPNLVFIFQFNRKEEDGSTDEPYGNYLVKT